MRPAVAPLCEESEIVRFSQTRNKMARKLTEREMRQVDRWAHRTELVKMLDFFQSFSTPIWIPRPVLLGSNNENEIWLQGYMPGRRAIEAIRKLDEPYNPHVPLKKTLVTQKRPERLPGTPFKGLYEVLRTGLTRTCLLRSLGGCGEQIVRSHSIQKSAFNGYATDDRRVYHFDPLTRPDEGVRLRLVGVNRATTFTAFCDHHDRTIFRPIEAVLFENRADQAFLFHYRAFAWTYYDRAHRTDILKAMHADLTPRVGQGEIVWLAERIRLNSIDLRELDQAKQRYEMILKTGNAGQFVFRTFRMLKVPGIACAELFAPNKDLFGTAIQDGKQIVDPMQWISLTILPNPPTGGLVIVGSEYQNEVFNSFVDSLAAGTSASRTARITQLGVWHGRKFYHPAILVAYIVRAATATDHEPVQCALLSKAAKYSGRLAIRLAVTPC
jgi:hypothetical protein